MTEKEQDASESVGPLGLGERYRRLFNKRGQDWWSIVFGYPVGRFLVLILPPFSWITPTLLTFMGFGTRLGASILVLNADPLSTMACLILLQITTVLDAMDGTLARYRKMGSIAGAFYDKILDGIGLFILGVGLGMRAYMETGNPWLIPAACGAGAAYIAVCYMYWVVEAVREKEPTAASLSGEAPVPTWGGIAQEWLAGWKEIIRFNEADLYFWVCLFIVLDQWAIMVYFLLITQGFTLIKRGFDHSRFLSKMDQKSS